MSSSSPFAPLFRASLSQTSKHLFTVNELTPRGLLDTGIDRFVQLFQTTVLVVSDNLVIGAVIEDWPRGTPIGDFAQFLNHQRIRTAALLSVEFLTESLLHGLYHRTASHLGERLIISQATDLGVFDVKGLTLSAMRCSCVSRADQAKSLKSGALQVAPK